jgi:hypothetical protein
MHRFPGIRGPIAGLLLTLSACGAAQASSVWIAAVTPLVSQGDNVVFELWMDFSGEPTIGGGVDIAYSGFTAGSQLTLVSYIPYLGNPDFIGAPDFAPGDPGLTSAPIPDPNGWGGTTMAPVPAPGPSGLIDISFGDLTTPIDGSYLVGTLTFLADLVGGPYTLTPGASANVGGFYTETGTQLFPLFSGDSVTVEPGAQVPLPGSALLLLGGLAALVPAARRRVR